MAIVKKLEMLVMCLWLNVVLSCESWNLGFKNAPEPYHTVKNDEKKVLI